MSKHVVDLSGNHSAQYIHPAMCRRILELSPNPMMQLQVCWQKIVDQTEKLEGILRTVATSKSDPETTDGVMEPVTVGEQAVLLAANGLRLAQTLMVEYASDEADNNRLPTHIERILSGVLLLLAAASGQSSADVGNTGQ